MSDKDKIIEAHNLLNELVASIRSGCTVEQDDVVDIRCLYYKCKEFISAVDDNPIY